MSQIWSWDCRRQREPLPTNCRFKTMMPTPNVGALLWKVGIFTRSRHLSDLHTCPSSTGVSLCDRWNYLLLVWALPRLCHRTAVPSHSSTTNYWLRWTLKNGNHKGQQRRADWRVKHSGSCEHRATRRGWPIVRSLPSPASWKYRRPQWRMINLKLKILT